MYTNRLVLTLCLGCTLMALSLATPTFAAKPDCSVDPSHPNCKNNKGGGGGDPDADTGSNSTPVISGTPESSVKIGEPYSFKPSALDPDGDTLTFTIKKKPVWAEFNSSTGQLSGMPLLGNEGTYRNILIKVSDGQLSASLPSFSVTVNQISVGSATLSWIPPTQNEDGSPLTDLAGYKIFYGTEQGNYPTSIQINNPSISTYVVENLTPKTYYFVATAFNSSGVESALSNEAVQVVN